MANILCGHCRLYHATVAEVKACSTNPTRIVNPVDAPILADEAEQHGRDYARSIAEARQSRAQKIEDGIYRDGTLVYKVYTSIQSGRTLCKLLQMDGQGGKPQWFYKGMAYRFVNPSQKMTLEEAKEFGQIYGVCCRCGRTLTDETSIANGIGPICAESW